MPFEKSAYHIPSAATEAASRKLKFDAVLNG